MGFSCRKKIKYYIIIGYVKKIYHIYLFIHYFLLLLYISLFKDTAKVIYKYDNMCADKNGVEIIFN